MKKPVNYVKLECWVVDVDVTQNAPFAERRAKKGLPATGYYGMMRVVTLGPTAAMGANFFIVAGLGEALYNAMKDLKKGDHVLVEGRLGYKFSKRYGKQYRILADSLTVLPPEEMPLYDYMSRGKHPLEWKMDVPLSGLAPDRRVVRTAIDDSDAGNDEEVPF